MSLTSVRRAAISAALALAVVVPVVQPSGVAWGGVASCSSAGGIDCAPRQPFWGFDDRVRAILRVDGVVYVGGRFRNAVLRNPDGSVAQTVRREHLAAFDAATGDLLPWAPRIIAKTGTQENGDVYDLATFRRQGSTKPSILVVGEFLAVRTTADGTTYPKSVRRHVAAFSPDGFGAIRPFRVDTDYRPRTIARTKRWLYLGGTFSWVDAKGQKRLTRHNVAQISLREATFGRVSSWKPRTNGSVNDLDTLPNGDVAIGGLFTRLWDKRRERGPFLGIVSPEGRVRRFADPPAGRVLAVEAAPGTACGLDASDACVLTGQAQYPGSGVPNNRAVLYDRSGTQVWFRKTNGDIQAVEWAAGQAIIGGHFGLVKDPSGDFRSKKLAALNAVDGSIDTTWKPRISNLGPLGVWGLTAYSDALYVGGDFMTVRTMPATRFATFPIV